ncbi:TPA: cytochrome c, partial [Burkholderia multivorans]|nr:cytochrome c [Burkholderia multivorans]
MALISPARFRFRFRFGLRCARRPAVVALALSAVLGGCDPLDDGSAQRDTADAADAASAASAPEPASGWRFTRIRAPADAAMAARAERDARLSARHGGAAAGGGASDAQASASAASGTGAAVPDASAHDDVRRPLVAATA